MWMKKTFTMNAEDCYDMIRNFVQPKLNDMDLYVICIFNRIMSFVIQLIKQLLYCIPNFLIMSFFQKEDWS